MYQDMIQYVKEFFEHNSPKASNLPVRYPFRKRFDHIMRVYKWAQRINEVENGDEQVLYTAAIFHDIGKAVGGELPHALISAEICEDYLKASSFPADKIEKVLQAVRLHSSKDDTSLNLNLEDKILMDADLCDEVGATAVLWDNMAIALEDAPDYLKAYERHLEYYHKLELLKNQLKTPTGKRFYEERLSFLGRFINELKYELGL